MKTKLVQKMRRSLALIYLRTRCGSLDMTPSSDPPALQFSVAAAPRYAFDRASGTIVSECGGRETTTLGSPVLDLCELSNPTATPRNSLGLMDLRAQTPELHL
jgi:hypothetical protein